MAMQVILTQDVDNLGKAGELVSVKPGHRAVTLTPEPRSSSDRASVSDST